MTAVWLSSRVIALSPCQPSGSRSDGAIGSHDHIVAAIEKQGVISDTTLVCGSKLSKA